jgi:hypothetical protein
MMNEWQPLRDCPLWSDSAGAFNRLLLAQLPVTNIRSVAASYAPEASAG